MLKWRFLIRPLHLDGVQGAHRVQRSEAYIKYAERAAQPATQQSAKSTSSAGVSVRVATSVRASPSATLGPVLEKSLKRVRAEKPTRIVEDAISGMLPKTKLGKQMFRKLKVYAGDRHPHAAQKPAALTIPRKVQA